MTYSCGHGELTSYIRCPICVQQELDNAKLQIDELKAKVEREHACAEELKEGCKKQYAEFCDEMDKKDRLVEELQNVLKAGLDYQTYLKAKEQQARGERVSLDDMIKRNHEVCSLCMKPAPNGPHEECQQRWKDALPLVKARPTPGCEAAAYVPGYLCPYCKQIHD